jgi:hypothetical protein
MTITENHIAAQREKVFSTPPNIQLVAPCKINQGILQQSKEAKEKLARTFHLSSVSTEFFIPASGSGSRMFQFLFDFLEQPNDENRGQTERFLNHLEEFAFYRKIDQEIKGCVRDNDISLKELVRYIITETGLNFGNLPKGLIPFHVYDYFILNPFQEHTLQACKLGNGSAAVHFTINERFEEAILSAIHDVKQLSGYHIDTSFSIQNTESDSIAFKQSGEIMEIEKGIPLTRPSGHGALLENLNARNSEFIFIKNIDNIQHGSQLEGTVQEFSYLAGLLIELNARLRQLEQQPVIDRTVLRIILEDFQLSYHPEDVCNLSDTEIRRWINRPRRVCGMVKNEGQPGGGPFWVKNQDGSVSKQVVEKSQISSDNGQFNIMVKSSHFNPVMMVVDIHDLSGNKHDLKQFRDEQTYFIVKKKFKGHSILFAEQPGLWNGSMADWTTIFAEISSHTFSPVKTVLDLLQDAHINR